MIKALVLTLLMLWGAAHVWSNEPFRCKYAEAKLGDVPMICHDRASFSQLAQASGMVLQKSVGLKDIFDVPTLFPLVAKMISLYNEDRKMLMAQFIFPANDAENSYRKIRVILDRTYGVGRRLVGYERSPVFKYRWRLKDGVVITFNRRRGVSHARLTYSRPHMVRAFLGKKGYQSHASQKQKAYKPE